MQETGGFLVELACWQDLAALGIHTKEGVNITAFLDHVAACRDCRRAEAALVAAPNGVIGGEKEG